MNAGGHREVAVGLLRNQGFAVHCPALSEPRVGTLLLSGDGRSHSIRGHLFASCLWGTGGAR